MLHSVILLPLYLYFIYTSAGWNVMEDFAINNDYNFLQAFLKQKENCYGLAWWALIFTPKSSAMIVEIKSKEN